MCVRAYARVYVCVCVRARLNEWSRAHRVGGGFALHRRSEATNREYETASSGELQPTDQLSF